MEKDVLSAISILEGRGERFDIVFMDPPYNKEIEKKVLERLKDSSVIDGDSIIIVEAFLDTDFSYASDMGYEIIKEKKYKTNKHMIMCR
jgi:16S rRNA (guanine966-N2)-methyltransferase